jgi:PqqD family protein of HPr-rel-A system
MGRSPLWSVPPASVFHWREWDQEFVVYHQQSGDTHRLNRLGARLLTLLIERPRTAAELMAEISDDFGPAQGLDSPSAVEALLLRLADLGLIESRYDDPPDAGAAGSR